MSHAETIQKRTEELGLAALLSRAVYDFTRGRETASSQKVAETFWNVSSESRENASVLIADLDGTTWVAYCGSNELRDWSNNTDAKLVPAEYIDGHVHEGFEYHARFLDKMVDRRATGAKRLIFTGHSLGSALAIRTAARYGFEWRDRMTVVGFATPRVFDCMAAYLIDHVYRLDIHRINILSDLIDHVPLHDPEGFCHVGRAMYLDSWGRITTEERSMLSRAFRLIGQYVRLFFPWNAHSMSEYQRRLELWDAITALHWPLED